MTVGLGNIEDKTSLLGPFCVLCGQTVERWRPYRISSLSPFLQRLDVIGSALQRFACPSCGSMDRERHLALFFSRLGLWDWIKNRAVLHIAPEPTLSRRLVDCGARLYVRGDLQPTARSIETIDVQDMPFPDQSFDLVLCNHVLEHVADPVAAAHELHRVLRPGGRLVCQTPFAARLTRTLEEPLLQSELDRLFFYGQEDHLRLFGSDIEQLLLGAGFEGRLVPHCVLLPEVDPEAFGINEKEPFFDFVRGNSADVITTRSNRGMRGPNLDVLLVTYNHESYIAQAIDGILCQDYAGKLRVIVTDDGSSDATLKIIKSIAEQQRRVEFVFLENTNNLGITANYKRGFAACAAEYVAVLEGDDFWASSRKLSKQVAFLEEHRECVACSCNYYVYDEQKISYELRVPNAHTFLFLTARSLIADNLIGNFSTCVYRRSVLERLPPALFSLTAYDWIVNICASMHGIIGFICEPLSVYRIHGQGAYNRLSQREKIEGQIALIAQYDDLTGHVFSQEFDNLRNNLSAHPALVAAAKQRSVSRRPHLPLLVSLCPPLVIWLIKVLLPPSLLHRLRAALT